MDQAVSQQTVQDELPFFCNEYFLQSEPARPQKKVARNKKNFTTCYDLMLVCSESKKTPFLSLLILTLPSNIAVLNAKRSLRGNVNLMSI